MSDDEKTRGEGFTWGLRPGGEPKEPKDPDATEPEAKPVMPLDLGHFLALNQTEMIAAATEPDPMTDPIRLPVDDSVDDGEPTAAFDFRAPPPPPVDPLQAPVYHAGHALPWEQPPAFDPALDGATEVLGPEAVGMDTPAGESAPTSAIDALFGEGKFHEYTDAPVSVVIPVTSHELVTIAPPAPPKRPKGPRAPMAKSQKVLVGIAAALVAALALAGLFFIGTRLSEAPPVAEATPAPSAPAGPASSASAEAPVAPVAALGPVAPGVHEWKDLLGTECLDPFVSAWESEYTVVDCAAPHGGQLVYRGRFDDSALDAFPGLEPLQARMNLLCSSPENIDYAAASEFDDIQISSSFAGTEEDWASGNRNYFCFVSRSSGDPLTMGVAMPPRAPAVIPVVPSQEP
ncbi:hypothetical protein GCM10027413_01590 [Conyzicola nivalis]|uniref:Septum formation-related domain-containing protein n=1 Tax=Conyzicola nivalis TaxID=1477021 RepID=A0A916WKS6_9MICO|nr:hypothetical protein [Conyzicola nivalis]GGB09451.1 hypothetical protein GCM10010979_25050 [Conyzicola nivalis]